MYNSSVPQLLEKLNKYQVRHAKYAGTEKANLYQKKIDHYAGALQSAGVRSEVLTQRGGVLGEVNTAAGQVDAALAELAKLKKDVDVTVINRQISDLGVELGKVRTNYDVLMNDYKKVCAMYIIASLKINQEAARTNRDKFAVTVDAFPAIGDLNTSIGNLAVGLKTQFDDLTILEAIKQLFIEEAMSNGIASTVTKYKGLFANGINGVTDTLLDKDWTKAAQDVQAPA
jgi:hypothetical protein